MTSLVDVASSLIEVLMDAMADAHLDIDQRARPDSLLRYNSIHLRIDGNRRPHERAINISCCSGLAYWKSRKVAVVAQSFKSC
jgi:hypothetical protein